MAIIPITNSYILINAVDLSDHVQQVVTADSRDKIDITAMGATSKVYTKGLGDATATITFFNDWAAAKVHATLQPLISSTTPFTIEIRPVNSARSATNPAFLMSALLFDYSFLNVTVGEAPTMDVEFTNAAQAGVTYPVA
jgi:hypothetical protein